MAVTKEFAEAVQNKSAMRVRIMLKDSLLVDPSAKQFDEMISFATEKMGDIYVPHDGENLEFNNASWTKEYLNQQMVAAVNGFSKERINLLKAMVKYLYKDKLNKAADKTSKTSLKNRFTHKQIGIGAIVAGGILLIAGICISGVLPVILVIGGILALGAGAVLIISDKRRS